MSRRAVAWIIALGCVALAVGIWRHRVVADPQATEAPHGESTRANASTAIEPAIEPGRVVPSGHEEPKPKLLDERPLDERFAVPAEPTELPVSKIADAKSEERRQFFWSYLRSFAAKAELTDSEWERFIGDISDVSSSGITAYDTAMEEHASVEDASRLSSELALELDERCASWMTEKQLGTFRQQINANALIMMTRHLRTFADTSAILSDARR